MDLDLTDNTAQFGDVATRLLARPFIVFAGAGLSRSAGIPIANELQNYILAQLGFSQNDLNIFLEARLPFEAFFEVLLRTVDCNPLLSIFGLGKPTRNHLLLARLAQSKINVIVTTNFDALIEEALDLKSVPYRVYSSDQALSHIDWGADDVKIIKLHGTVSDPDSLALTIRRVAAQGLATSRAKAITELFSRLNENTLIVFGYSCSDRFDVSPVIRRVSQNDQNVIYVRHQERGIKATLRRLVQCDPLHLFAGCNAEVLDCCADELISALWEEAFREEAPPPTSTTNPWTSQVDTWILKLQSAHGEAVLPYLAGLMHKAANNWLPSNGFLITALKKGIQNDLRSTLHLAVGNNCRDNGDRRGARTHFRAALAIARHLGQADKEGSALNSLGILAEDQNEHDVAIQYYQEALAIADRTRNPELQGKCHGNIGIALKNKGGSQNLEEALKHHEQALEIARDLGDKRSEGRTLGNLGVTYSDLGDKVKAKAYYLDAQQVAEDLGDSLHVGIWLHNAGEDAVGTNNDEASKLLHQAIMVFRALGQDAFVRQSESCLEKIKKFA